MERFNFNLQLFAEGGAAGGAGATGGNAGAGAEGDAGANQSQAAAVTSKRANSNPLANVQYGKQEDVQQSDAGAESNQGTTPEKTPYEDLIKGDYKEEHSQYMDKVIGERLKNQKKVEAELRQQMDSMNPIMDMLAAKYGIDSKDMKALAKAIEEDDAYYEAEASDKGVSVEQLKQMRKMEHENTVLRNKMQETMQQDQIRKDIEEWMKQGEEVKKTYPNFDFKTESNNREFTDLITRGIPVQTAYEIIHKDEIMGGAMQYAVQQTAQKVSQNIQSRAKRPSENGVASNSGIVTKADVHSLTKADRAEIARRVARGERITF